MIPAHEGSALLLADGNVAEAVSYQGLDSRIIERSDSAFPPGDPDAAVWLEPLPLVSTGNWLELLGSPA